MSQHSFFSFHVRFRVSESPLSAELLCASPWLRRKSIKQGVLLTCANTIPHLCDGFWAAQHSTGLSIDTRPVLAWLSADGQVGPAETVSCPPLSNSGTYKQLKLAYANKQASVLYGERKNRSSYGSLATLWPVINYTGYTVQLSHV